MIRLLIDGQDVPYAELTLTFNPRYPAFAWNQPMPYQAPTTTVQYIDGAGTRHRLEIEGAVGVTRDGDTETITITTPGLDKP